MRLGWREKCHSDVLYTPAANYNGTDQFSFTATGPDGPDTATTSITITAVNDAPVCSGDSSSGNEDTGQSGTVTCTDVESSTLTYARSAARPTAQRPSTSNGRWSYTPNANYNGPDSFTFKANDGTADSNVATVSITVTRSTTRRPGDDPAPATTRTRRRRASVELHRRRRRRRSPTAVVTAPAHGTAPSAPTAPYLHAGRNYNGADSFTFKANDGTVDSNVATVHDHRHRGERRPGGAPDSGSRQRGHATDVGHGRAAPTSDGDTLTYTKVAGPSHGTARSTLNDGACTYTPAANYNGPDSFTFKANDGTVDSNIATVSITVTAVNDAPVAAARRLRRQRGHRRSRARWRATDVEGDSADLQRWSPTAGHGTASVAPNGALSYTPAANYNGADSFTFKANDGS